MNNEVPVRIGVTVIVLDQTQTKILMGKRKNAYRSGWYGLPGGRLEVGETLEKAALRELWEETHLKAIKLMYLGAVREGQGLDLPRDKQYDFIHFVFLCDSHSGDLQLMEPDKCEGWEWVSLGQMPSSVLVGHQGAITLLQEYQTGKLSYLIDWPHSK